MGLPYPAAPHRPYPANRRIAFPPANIFRGPDGQGRLIRCLRAGGERFTMPVVILKISPESIPVRAEESITEWIDGLRAGEELAAQRLWERYFANLVRLARKRLRGVRRGAADEEDVALSAFNSFCRAVAEDRFPQLADRDGLWRLLVTIAERKAVDHVRAEHRHKRGGGRVVGESQVEEGESDEAAGLAGLPGREPTPAFAALVAEQCERLLNRLDDPGLRTLALLKLEGYANEEVAVRLGCALRTVERKLGVIRSLWQREVG